MNSTSSSPVCYRHPAHKAGVTCQRCSKHICPSCMVSASVGFHCPECAGIKREGTISGNLGTGGGQGVGAKSAGGSRRSARPWSKYTRRLPARQDAGTSSYQQPFAPFTTVILVINLVVFGISVYQWGTPFPADNSFNDVQRDYGLADIFLDFRFPPNEWWRVFTSAFVHSGVFHIAFNMFLFFVLGRLLENAFGTFKLGILYMTAILGGSFGALLLQGPRTLTVGASGGVFGLMGAYIVLTKFSGARIMNSPIAFLLILNILFSFVFSNVSLGGHLGGLSAGVIVGGIYTYLAREIPTNTLRRIVTYGLAILVGGLIFWGCLLVADAIP